MKTPSVGGVQVGILNVPYPWSLPFWGGILGVIAHVVGVALGWPYIIAMLVCLAGSGIGQVLGRRSAAVGKDAARIALETRLAAAAEYEAMLTNTLGKANDRNDELTRQLEVAKRELPRLSWEEAIQAQHGDLAAAARIIGPRFGSE